MAKAKNIVFTGKAYWARVYEGNHDEYGGKEFYKITVALDGESWAKFSKSGLSLKTRPCEEDGDDSVTFKRDVHPKTGTDKTGKKYSLGGGTPRVVDRDGATFEELIGNGSEVEVLVNVYTIGKGPLAGKKGHRLEAVKVLEHIPYEAPDDEDEEETEVETPQEETPPVKTSPKTTSKKGVPF